MDKPSAPPPDKTAGRKDPLPVFCFRVSLGGDNAAVAFFKSVSGIKYEQEILPVAEGGVNDTVFQLPGRMKWSNIILKQGFTGSSALIDWRTKWVQGEMTRRNGTIELLDTALKGRATWNFVAGWPVKWEISEFDASKSELAIETMEIAHHGITFGPGSGA